MADPYWSDVVFLSGFEGGAVVDESDLAQTVTLSGTTDKTSSQAKFGSQSLAVPDASGAQGASVPDHANMSIGAQDFTIETFVRLSADPGAGYKTCLAQMDYGTGTGCSWELLARYDTDEVEFACYEDADASGSYVVLNAAHTWTLDTWFHVVADFDGTKYRLYVDGSMVASDTTVITVANSDANLTIGHEPNSGTPTQMLRGAFFDETRITIGTARYASDGGYTVPAAAFERGAGPATYEEEAEDTVELTELFAPGYTGSITDNVAVSEATARIRLQYTALLQALQMREIDIATSRGYLIAESDTLELSELLASIRGVLVAEGIDVDELIGPAAIYTQSVLSLATVADNPFAGMPLTAADTLTLTAAAVAATALQIAERLDLADMLQGAATYGLTAEDRLRVAVVLGQFLGAEASDALALDIVVLAAQRAPVVVVDAVTVTAEVLPRLLLSAVTEDTVDITAAQVLQAILTGTVLEAITVDIAHVGPDGSITTWAMNTRTGAVSEYANYNFNSFARVGNKYLGAADSGLYELQGDTDDGAGVVAVLKGGFLQFGGTHLSRLKAAYIAATGDDNEFVLRVETRDGAVYDYRVATRSGRNTKVHMGKGQRARYFAYTLTSTGQEFALDTLEFVPIVLERRV